MSGTYPSDVVAAALWGEYPRDDMAELLEPHDDAAAAWFAALAEGASDGVLDALAGEIPPPPGLPPALRPTLPDRPAPDAVDGAPTLRRVA